MKKKLLFSIAVIFAVIALALPVGKLAGGSKDLTDDDYLLVTDEDVALEAEIADGIDEIFVKYEPVSEENRDELRGELMEYLTGLESDGKVSDVELDESQWLFTFRYGSNSLQGGVRYFELPDEGIGSVDNGTNEDAADADSANDDAAGAGASE